MRVHAICSVNMSMFPCRNAAAVLRIRRSAIDLEREPDPLDDMRIHPEHYTLAVSMCSKALEGSKRTADDDDDQLLVEQAINARHRDQVAGLDLAVRPGKSVACTTAWLLCHSLTLCKSASSSREGCNLCVVSNTWVLLVAHLSALVGRWQHMHICITDHAVFFSHISLLL